jgi:hypothetical protein
LMNRHLLQSGFHQPILPFELLIVPICPRAWLLNQQTGTTDKPLKSTTFRFLFV